MRIIEPLEITKSVRRLFIDANYFLGDDILCAVREAAECGSFGTAKNNLKNILENAEIAKTDKMPICQDTGMAVVFIEIGQEVHVRGSIEEAVYSGVAAGCRDGYLRASVVRDPLRRENTGDNTPAVIHYSFTEGDKIKITVAPKGFGSENKSALRMLTPADGREGVVDFVVQTVKRAGADPCPPVIVGVGIGGTMEKAAILSKLALTRDLNAGHSDGFYAGMERELLEKINALGIGPYGLGGRTTALSVHIEAFPTHIAGLPVAVNIGCHVTRHKATII